MASTLTIAGCSVQTNSITVTFSEAVDKTSSPGSTSATDQGNYRIFDPSANLNTPTLLNMVTANITVAPGDDERTVTFVFGTALFNPGDFVLIQISNIALASDLGTSALIDDPVSISRQVPGKGKTARLTRDVEDAIAYPLLTEEVSYRPFPVGTPGGGGVGGGGGTSNLSLVATKAVSDVLGWKANSTDAKGFVGALTQAFTLTDVEGHVESTWSPRTYAVQTDLGGGITGAQASLYTRAKDALDQSLALLDGLYPLDPEADPEYVKALREMARSQMTEIVKEFGAVGLPSTLRIDTYFGILLGQNPSQLLQNSVSVVFDPDAIGGTLGKLRDTYGIFFAGNPFNNSVEDEQDITNFRVISDYMTSLMQSWIANRNFFRLAPDNPAFFGTQLVLISRQFNVIVETVNEVRFALDSVFIGPSERQTLLLEFADGTDPMFLEDVLEEVEKFATDEGPRLLRDGGKISVTNNILPVVQSLQNLVQQAHEPKNLNVLPGGFKTIRVRNSLDDLQDQLAALINLTGQVEQQVPDPEDELIIGSVLISQDDNHTVTLTILGEGFDPGTLVTILSSPASALAPPVIFYSAQRIDVTFDPTRLTVGLHDINVTNSSGASRTLANSLKYTGGNIGPAASQTKGGAKVALRKGVPKGSTGPTPAGGSASSPSSREVAALSSRIDHLKQGQDKLSQKIDEMWTKIEKVLQQMNKDHKP